MTIEINTIAKTIKLKDNVYLTELLEWMKEMNLEFDEYMIIPNREIVTVKEPNLP